MNNTAIRIDLAKSVFSLHGVDAQGKIRLKKAASRSKLLECFANIATMLDWLGGLHRRPLVRIDPIKLDLALQQWSAAFATEDQSLAIDGKTMCNTVGGNRVANAYHECRGPRDGFVYHPKKPAFCP